MSYRKTLPPDIANVQDLLDYLTKELDAVQEATEKTDLLRLDTTYKAPIKPRNGMVVLADGTTWNPGSGAGFYGYYAGSWKKLG